MLDNNQAFLLEFIKNALFKTPLIVPDDIDWEALYEESASQTVTSLIAESVPTEHSARFKNTMLNCRAQYMKILYEQSKLVELLSANSIPVIVIKGSAAAKYYPVPFNRTMGDIDIIVPEAEYERSNELLKHNNYIYDHEDDGRHATYFKNGICIELHLRFSNDCPPLEEIISNSYSTVQQEKTNGYTFPYLPEAANGLLILAHIRHHILNQGLGLRQIIDWEMFAHAHPENDFWQQEFIPLAEKCELMVFARIINGLCKTYLGMPDNISCFGEVDASRLEHIIEAVLRDGNFGIKTYVEPTPTEIISLRIRNAIKEKRLFRFLQEEGVRNWQACRRFKILKPFAFIYQIFRYAFKGIQAAFHGNVIKQIGNANERFEFHQDFEINEK